MKKTGNDELVRAVLSALPRAVRLREVVTRLGLSSSRALEELVVGVLATAELRAACRSLGLPSTGPRDALVARLLDRVAPAAEEEAEPHSVVSVLATLLATLPARRARELADGLGLPSRGPHELLVLRVALGVESDPASITRFLGGLSSGELRACADRVGLPRGGEAHVLALRLSAWIDLFRPEPPAARRASARGLLLGRWRVGPVRFATPSGTVHDAVDVLLPGRAACRAIVAHVPSDRALKAEVGLGLELAGPGLVHYLDHAVDEDGRDVAIVADPGLPLTTWLAQHGPVPTGQAVRLTLILATALDLAHTDGALHGDVHPDAVWLAPDGDRPRLGAFGLRRGRDGSADARARARPAAAAWLAPEVSTCGIVTPKSDQHGLALLFASLVTGRAIDTPADASGLGDLTAAQQAALRRALSRAAGDRFESCLDLALALLAP